MVNTPKTPTYSRRTRSSRGGLPSPSPTPTSRRRRGSQSRNPSEREEHRDGESSESASQNFRGDSPRSTSVFSTASDWLPSIEELVAETSGKGKNRDDRSMVEESEGARNPSGLCTVKVEPTDIPHWRRLKELVDSMLRTDVIEDIAQKHLISSIRDTKAKLDKLSQVVLNHATCSLCSRIMEKVFTVSCGHSYCGRCLRHFFEKQLFFKLNKLVDSKRIPGKEFGPTPQDVHQKERLVEHLEALECNPTEYFTYSCPAPACDVILSTPPILSYQNGHLNFTVADTLMNSDYSHKSNLGSSFEYASEGTPDYFIGLFL